jgi:Asp-tRNA(Asn)/Glu-tRNA(Gln) amidotransferase C subunit
MSDDSDQVKQMARRAGIKLTDERAQGLTGALRNLSQVSSALAAIDYGEAEPAARFKAPRPDK